MKRRELLRHLVDQGCVLLKEGAKHSRWINLADYKQSAVPRHQEVDDQLAKAICKQLGIPPWK